LILLPTLPWSKESKKILTTASIIRTFSLQTLYMDPIDHTDQTSQAVGEALNFFFPWAFSFSYTVLLFVTFIVSFLFRFKIVLKMLHYLILFLPALYFPVLHGFLNALTCNFNWNVRSEILPHNCYDLTHFGFAIVSFFSIAPFILLSLFLISIHYEWRPNSANLLAKPHTRYDIISTVLVTSLLGLTTIFERYAIFLLFLDFTVFLMLVGLHLYFMEWYKTVVNQIVCTFLLLSMAACMIAVLVASLKLLYPFF